MYFYFLHFDLFIIIIINSIINKILREKMIEIKVFDLIFRNFSYKYIYIACETDFIPSLKKNDSG